MIAPRKGRSNCRQGERRMGMGRRRSSLRGRDKVAGIREEAWNRRVWSAKVSEMFHVLAMVG
jgi:hypothetical protein